MAWHFYSFFEHHLTHGPLPEKRWIPAATDKRHKVRHSSKVSRAACTESADRMNERHAIEYARWLAGRDGISIPQDAAPRVDWSEVRELTGKSRKRARAVEFGRDVTERTGHGRNAYTSHRWDVAVRIEIPNWDFVPAEPVEEIIQDLAPVPVAPSFRIPARFLGSSCLAPVPANDRRSVAPSCIIRVA